MSDGTAYDLSGKLHAQPATPVIHRPGASNYWLIPGAILITLGLWGGVLCALGSDTDPAVSTVEMALFIGAGVFTVSTALVVKEYLVHRAMADDHAAILDEVGDLRTQLLVAGAEHRAMLEQISAKHDQMKELYWEDFAENAAAKASGGGVVPFSQPRRR